MVVRGCARGDPLPSSPQSGGTAFCRSAASSSSSHFPSTDMISLVLSASRLDEREVEGGVKSQAKRHIRVPAIGD